jgi:hypothetical protein
MNKETSIEITDNTQTEITDNTQTEKRLVPTIYIVLGVILLLVLAGLFIWGMVWLAQNQSANIEAVRDIFIIALAMESCLFGIVLIILLVMVVRLVNMLEFEIKPILEKTNETVGMVRGTSVFVSENVVKPVTKANSYVAGVRRGFQALFGNPKKNLRD